MTKLSLILCVALLATVFAADYVGERPVWQLVGSNWVSLGPTGQTGVRARAWCGPSIAVDSSNKRVNTMLWQHKASVAQWIKYILYNDGYYWLVRKPGDYVTDGIYLNIQSNYDVVVTFSGFEDLTYVGPGTAIDNTIEVKYAFTDEFANPPPPGSDLWKTPTELNNYKFDIFDSGQLHEPGWRKYIWAWISVSRCNTACNYKDIDGATITLTLQRIKDWIDPGTGLYKGGSVWNVQPYFNF